MRFSLPSALGAFTLLATPFASALSSYPNLIPRLASKSTCATPGAVPKINGTEIRNIGMVLFPAFDMIDVYGTLDPLQYMSLLYQKLDLHLIAKTLDPVQTRPPALLNIFNSNFFPEFRPTNTFDDDLDLDVLIVPGGPGSVLPNLNAEIAYIKKMFPKVKIFMTVCTGATLAAQSGVLDGHLATTNKFYWDPVTLMRPSVNWVTPARYVIDGKIWTASGVTSGLDMIFAFIKTFWGAEPADNISNIIEHKVLKADEDEFSTFNRIKPSKYRLCEKSVCA